MWKLYGMNFVRNIVGLGSKKEFGKFLKIFFGSEK